MPRLLLPAALALSVLSCGTDSRRSAVETIRTTLDPPEPPPDTIPEGLDYAADLEIAIAEMSKLPVGVLYAEMQPGEGNPVLVGDSVEIGYRGWLPNGILVDSGSAVLRVGAGDVISGIDAALPGMKPGARRKLILTPGLAFGAEGREHIPPNAVLVYDVDLRARIP